MTLGIAFLVVLLIAAAVGGMAYFRASRLRRAAGSTRCRRTTVLTRFLVLVPALLVLVAWAPMQSRLIDQAVLSSPEGQALPDFEMQRQTILDEARQIAHGEIEAGFNPESDDPRAARHGGRGALRSIGGDRRHPRRTRRRRDHPSAQARPGIPCANGGRAVDERPAAARLAHRDLHDARDRPVAAVRIPPLLQAGAARAISCSACRWSPQMAIRADQAGSSGAFGSIPLFWGTIFIGAIIAMIVAIPLGLMSAIYLTQYAAPQVRSVVKPPLEILAGVPTVVYGYFAALPLRRRYAISASALGVSSASSESALAAGLVMGVMIIPVRQLDGR